VAEWTNAAALKAAEVCASGGSNPSRSAGASMDVELDLIGLDLIGLDLIGIGADAVVVGSFEFSLAIPS
jgi:hypothetical protein